MQTPDDPVWYIRKSGWVQGPFTQALVRHMYATSWLGAIDRISTSPTGPWREVRQFPEIMRELPGGYLPPAERGWEVASPTLVYKQPVEFGMLQIFAAAGRLRPKDLVRRLPDGPWQPAEAVEGVFGGRRGWCTACGASLGSRTGPCPSCEAAQPDYDPSLARVAFVAGVVALAWYWIALVVVTVLAFKRMTVWGIALDEQFPLAFLLSLIPSLWLACVAALLGGWASESVRRGRASPADLDVAAMGITFGWSTLALLLLTAVAVVAFSLPYFGVVN